MFTDEHLGGVQKVARLIRRNCNTGVSHTDKKGLWYSIFDMWLVRNRIANLILLPWLKNDGFYVNYDTLQSWVVYCPYGTPILFKHDTGLYEQFPYVDLEYLNNIKFEAVTMLQTVRGKFEGFTKIEMEKANLAR